MWIFTFDQQFPLHQSILKQRCLPGSNYHVGEDMLLCPCHLSTKTTDPFVTLLNQCFYFFIMLQLFDLERASMYFCLSKLHGKLMLRNWRLGWDPNSSSSLLGRLCHRSAGIQPIDFFRQQHLLEQLGQFWPQAAFDFLEYPKVNLPWFPRYSYEKSLSSKHLTLFCDGAIWRKD